MQAILLNCTVLVASTLAAGTVVRPPTSAGVSWYPYMLGTDAATMAYKGYKLSGGYITSIRTAPYAQGCFTACSKGGNDNACQSWMYQKSTKKCSLFKYKAYTDSTKSPCVSWGKASSDFVSGWIYFGEDEVADYPACKK
jgi:PAN domain